jgi:myo-inositol-1(or 4)-monophosphatase
MTLYSQGARWTPILLEAAENVRGRVRKALLSRPALDIVEMKGLLDAEAQAAVVDTLRQSGISAHVISEEGECTVGEGGPYVVVDPVDGTTNLARGIPLAVTSLAVSETQHLSGAFAGVIMDLYTGEVFRAERNRGAWRGGRQINPAKPVAVRTALVSVDISKGAPIEPMKELIREAGHLRQLGCSALSLCHVASGLVDAHVDLRGSLRSTDVAAGLIILKEAGGIYKVDSSIGGDLELSRESTLRLVAASSPRTLEEILELVA